MAAKRGAKLALPGTDDPGTDASESGDHEGLPSVARAAAGPAVPLVVAKAEARALFVEAKSLSDDANWAGNRPPPRDPDEDDDDEDEDSDTEPDEPAVIREPDEDD
jgi:hypothetical protein